MTMPQGPSGLELDAWMQEWVLKPKTGQGQSLSDVSKLHTRTQGAVEAHFQASVPLTDPWAAARDALFGGLMGGFQNLTEFLGDLAEAIAGAGKRALEDITATITTITEGLLTIFQRLFDAAGNVVASIANALVDGLRTMGEFLAGLWDSLTGGSGSSDKTADDVAQELSALTSTAGTASANASSALTSAEDANSVIASKASGADNLVGNPGFENIRLSPGDGEYWGDATRVKSGSYSLRFTCDSTVKKYNLFNATVGQTDGAVLGRENETFYVEAWVYGEQSNPATTQQAVYFEARNYTTIITSYTTTIGGVTANECRNGWTKMSFYYTMPSPAIAFTITVNCAALPAPNVFYVDNPVVTAYTQTQSVIDAVEQGSNNNSSTGNSIDTLKENLASVVADANTGIQNAATAQGAADAASSIADSIITGGNNLIPNASFENLNFYFHGTEGASITDESVRTGEWAMKINGNSGYPYAFLFSSANGMFTAETKPGSVYYLSVWAKAAAGNSAAGFVFRLGVQLTDLDGGNALTVREDFEVPVNVPSDGWFRVETRLVLPTTGSFARVRPYVQLLPTATSSDAFFFDDAIMLDVTDAYNAELEAAAASNTAQNATVAAATAEAKALEAKSLLQEVITSGFNLCTNPSFENTGFLLNHPRADRIAPAFIGYSTEHSNTGLRSLKMVANGSQYVTQGLVNDGDTERFSIWASEDDVYWVEFWVYGGDFNDGSSGGVSLVIRCEDSAGNYTYPSIYRSASQSPVLEERWTKVSGFIPLSADTVAIQPYLQLQDTCNNGDEYFFDDVKVIRATEAYAAQEAAGTAQDTANAAGVSAGTANTNLQATWNDLYDAFTGSTGSANKTSADARVKAAEVRESAVTGEANAGTALTNASIADGKAVEAQDNVQLTWDELYDAFNASTGSTGKTAEDLGAKGAELRFTAAEAQSKISLKAKDFTNLVPGSDFDDEETGWALPSGFQIDSTQSKSRSPGAGGKSLKITSTPALNLAFYNGGGSVEQLFEAKPGEQFAIEMWVRKSSDYVGGTTDGPRFRLVRGNGPNAGNTITSVFLRASDIPSANAWHKFSVVTDAVPSDGTSTVFFAIFNMPFGTAGSVWVDDIVVRRVVVSDGIAENAITDGKIANSTITSGKINYLDGSKITSGSVAQDKVTNLTTDLAARLDKTTYEAFIGGGNNLATNPGFEDTKQYQLPNCTLSTDFARSGSRSAKVVSNGTNSREISPFNTSDNVLRIYVTSGQTYYCEFYFYQVNGTSSAGSTYLRIAYYDNDTEKLVQTPLGFTNSSTSHNGKWTKVFGYFRVPEPDDPADTYNNARVTVVTAGATASGTIRYIDDFILREVTEYADINQNLYGEPTPQLQIALGSVPDLPGSIITTGEIAEARVQNLATTKATAYLAQSIADAGSTPGSNLCSNPGYENPDFYINTHPNVTYNTDANYVRTGSRSLKLVTANGSFIGTNNISNSFGGVWIPTRDGNYYYAEGWARGVPGQPTTSLGYGVYIQIAVVRDMSEPGQPPRTTTQYGYLTVQQIGIDNTFNNGWVKLSGIVQIPDGWNAYELRFGSYTHRDNPSGLSVYFDDVVLYDITEAVKLSQSLYGANAPTEFIKSSLIQSIEGSKITGDGSIGSRYVQNLDGFKSEFDLRSKDFTNMLPGSDFEDAANSGWNVDGYASTSIVSLTNYDGRTSKVLRIVPSTGNSHIGYMGGNGGSNPRLFEVKPGEKILMKMKAARSSSYTGGDTRFRLSRGDGPSAGYTIANIYFRDDEMPVANKWYDLSTLATIPNDGTTKIYFKILDNSNSGGTVYLDDIVVRRVVDSELVGDLPGEKITSGEVPEARVQNLTATKNTANDAQSTALGSLESGGNLCPNPSFENDQFIINNGTYNTNSTYVRTGSKSLMITGASTSQVAYLTNSTTSSVYNTATEDLTLYMEVWVRADSSNTDVTSGQVSLFVTPYNAAKSPLAGQVAATVNAGPALEGGWTKLSGFVEVRSDAKFWRPAVNLNSAVTNGHKYYFDDVVVRDVSYGSKTNRTLFDGNETSETILDTAVPGLSGSKIVDGLVDESRVANLTLTRDTLDRIASTPNLVESPSFEDSSVARIPYGSTTPLSYETAQKHVGSQSLRWQNYPTATWRGVYLTPTSRTQYFEVSPGETIACSAFIRQFGNYTTHSGYVKLFMRWSTSGQSGYEDTNSGNNVLYNADMLGDNFKQLTNFGKCPEGRNRLLVFVINDPSTPLNNRYYVDAVSVYRLSSQSDVTGLPPGEEAGNETLAQTVARLGDDVADIKAELDVNDNVGKTIKVNFSDYGDVTNLATQNVLPDKKWSITNVNGTTYTGATWGTSYNVATFTGNTSSGSGTAKIIYLGDTSVAGSEKTLTDFQKIKGVLATPPGGISTGGPAFTALGRVSDDGKSYVWARAQFTSPFTLRGSMGYAVNGTETTWVSNIPLSWSLEMTFILGVDGNARKYQVYSGSTLVKGYTESGTSSRLGGTSTNYRRFGAIVSYSGGQTSGTISSVTVSDNSVPDFKGSVGRMVRTSTTSVTQAGGIVDIPAGFFADTTYSIDSLSVTVDESAGTFKVSKSGMYAVAARIKINADIDRLVSVVLRKSTNNGSTWVTVQEGVPVWPWDNLYSGFPGEHMALCGNWLQYLEAGDMVKLATNVVGGNTSKSLSIAGVSGGAETYFTISAL